MSQRYNDNIQNTDKTIQFLRNNIEKSKKAIAEHNDFLRKIENKNWKLSKPEHPTIARTKEHIEIVEIDIYRRTLLMNTNTK